MKRFSLNINLKPMLKPVLSFSKSDEFELNHIFLKKPQRIGALMMLMTLCLMVYHFAQYRIREVLKDSEHVLPNQLGKPVKNPTLRWLFQLMSSITVVSFYDEAQGRWYQKIANVKLIHRLIIMHFGEEAMKKLWDPTRESHANL